MVLKIDIARFAFFFRGLYEEHTKLGSGHIKEERLLTASKNLELIAKTAFVRHLVVEIETKRGKTYFCFVDFQK